MGCGMVSAFCCDPAHHWIVLGTNAGNLSGWDIRFHLPFRSWLSPSRAPIYSIIPNQSNLLGGSNSSIFCASHPAEFHLWDLDTGKCKQTIQLFSVFNSKKGKRRKTRRAKRRN